MSFVLPHLVTGWHVDQAIMSEEERLVIIRFGRDWDPDCMRQDEVLYRIAERVKNFAVIYVCDLDQVPDFKQMYGMQSPCLTSLRTLLIVPQSFTIPSPLCFSFATSIWCVTSVPVTTINWTGFWRTSRNWSTSSRPFIAVLRRVVVWLLVPKVRRIISWGKKARADIVADYSTRYRYWIRSICNWERSCANFNTNLIAGVGLGSYWWGIRLGDWAKGLVSHNKLYCMNLKMLIRDEEGGRWSRSSKSLRVLTLDGEFWRCLTPTNFGWRSVPCLGLATLTVGESTVSSSKKFLLVPFWRSLDCLIYP